MKKDTKKELVFDYKNPIVLSEYLEGSKISPIRTTGLTNKQQRNLCNAVKKARDLGLLPTDYKNFDNSSRRPELISPKPFKY